MKHMLLVAVFAFSFNAIANDGGMAFIDVKGINPKENASDGTVIEFYGKDAENFMRLLPAYSSVLHSMVRPEVAEQLQENDRGVAIVSKAWGLHINCNGGDLSHDGEDFKDAKFVPSMTKCSISLYKNPSLGDLGDAWPMEPKNYRKNMCQ